MPSIILAWFNASVIMTSSADKRASKIPAFASKHEGHNIVSSV